MLSDDDLHYIVASSNPGSPEHDWYRSLLRDRIIEKIRQQAGPYSNWSWANAVRALAMRSGS
jgi:hypothetical protein